MKKEFIPYELALKLKEIGFAEECIAEYDISDRSIHLIESFDSPSINKNEFLTAPLWQQAFYWFEDRYNLYVAIHGEALNGHRIGFYYSITEEGWINFYESVNDDLIFDTKEEARQACLKKLIKIIENGKA